MFETETSDLSKSTIFETWEEIAAIFKARYGLKFKSFLTTSMSSRLSLKRLSKLRETKQAALLQSLLSTQSNENLKALRTFAAINQEQANASFKMTMVANVSAPIGILALFHQLSPQGLGALILDVYDNDTALLTVIIISLLTLALIIFIAIYAVANLNQARDVRHLIDLYAAERGIYFGLEDMDADGLN